MTESSNLELNVERLGRIDTWSPSKDYSQDAHMSDALAIAVVTGSDQVIFMGHSASARVVIGSGPAPIS